MVTTGVRKDSEVAKLNRMFLFASETQLMMNRPESIFENIWTPVTSQGPVSILD